MLGGLSLYPAVYLVVVPEGKPTQGKHHIRTGLCETGGSGVS